jgi:MFS family permease
MRSSLERFASLSIPAVPRTISLNEYNALSYRDFRFFWSGQFVSLIGTWMQNTVLPLVAYRLTNQPIDLGIIGFASSIPGLLFTLPAGVFVEKRDKRRIVIYMQIVMMLQAFFMAYLTFTNQLTIIYIVMLAMVLGTASSLELTARQAMIVEMVGKKAIPNAIALNSAIFNGARVLGPTLTTPFLLLLHDQGLGWAFFANGFSYLFVIFSLLMIRTRSTVAFSQEQRSLLGEFMDGQKYIRATPVVFWLILIVTIPSFFGFPFGQQMPVFASDVLKGLNDNSTDVATRNSLLITAQGLGALIAALMLAVFSRIRRKGLGLMVGQIAFAAALIGFSFALNTTVASILLVVVGWGTVTQLALTNTLIQLSVPDQLRGRVISTYFWAQTAVAPFGSLFIGYLAQQFSAPLAVRVGGIVCLAGYLAVQIFQPHIRNAVA